MHSTPSDRRNSVEWSTQYKCTSQLYGWSLYHDPWQFNVCERWNAKY